MMVVVMLPDPFRGMGAWRNSTETQQTQQSDQVGSGPEVKNGKSGAEDDAPERLGCGTVKEEVSQILQRVSAGAAWRILFPFYPHRYCKRTKEGCDRGSEVGTFTVDKTGLAGKGVVRKSSSPQRVASVSNLCNSRNQGVGETLGPRREGWGPTGSPLGKGPIESDLILDGSDTISATAMTVKWKQYRVLIVESSLLKRFDWLTFCFWC